MTRKPTAYILLLVTACVLLAGCSPDGDHMRQRLQYVSDCNRADTVFSEAWLPTVDSLVIYFDHHGSANDRMMAHYVQGRVYHDLGEAPQALECYQKAAEQADTTSSDCDLYTLTAIYSQMADLFDAQYLPDDEMQALQMSENLAWKDKDTLSALVAYELRIRPYFLRKDTDSIIYFANHAYHKFVGYNLARKSQLSLPVIINLYLDRKEYGRAGNAIRLFEKESEQFDSLGNIVKGREIYYYDKGRYELAKGNIESAITYFNKALYGGYDEACYRGLLSVYEKLGKSDSISKYAKLFAAANDSSFLHVNQRQVEQVRANYNYQKHEREAHELKAKNDRMRVYLLLLSSAVVVMLLLAGLVVLLRRYKRQLVQSSMGKTDLLRYSYEQKTEQQKLSEREQVTGSTIYAAIQSHLGKAGDVPLSDDEWQQLHQTVNAVYPNFREKLTSLTPMNNFEYQVCLLLKIGVKPSEIASLTTHSRESVTSSRRRLYEKAMKKSGKPSDWDALVTIL